MKFDYDFKKKVLGIVLKKDATSICLRIHKDLRYKLKEYCLRSCYKESALLSNMIYNYLEEQLKKDDYEE